LTSFVNSVDFSSESSRVFVSALFSFQDTFFCLPFSLRSFVRQLFNYIISELVCQPFFSKNFKSF